MAKKDNKLMLIILVIVLIFYLIGKKPPEVEVPISQDIIEEMPSISFEPLKEEIIGMIGKQNADKISDDLLNEMALDELSTDFQKRAALPIYNVLVKTTDKSLIDTTTYVSRYTNYVATELGKPEILELAKKGEVSRLALDSTDVRFNLYWAVPSNSQTPYVINKGGENVRVCLLDSEIEENHPNLNVLYDIPGDLGNILHGTHVAGIINSNHPEFRGLAPDADIVFLGIKSFKSETMQKIEECLNYDAKILSMSWAYGYFKYYQDHCDDDPLAELLNTLVETEDVIAVASAGNLDVLGGWSPACASKVIAVAATTNNNDLAMFSSRGNYVDIAAPGYNVYSTWSEYNGFYRASGTSMAAPHISGAIALLKSISSKSNNQIIQAIYNTATPANCGGTPCGSREVGHGIINVYQACKQLEGDVCDEYFTLNPLRPEVKKPTLDGSGSIMTCFDGIKNQDEPNTDCGGICGNICSKPLGALCQSDEECASNKCAVIDAGRCVPFCEGVDCNQYYCTETDNGLDLFQQGTTTIWGKSYTDGCMPFPEENHIAEYYCQTPKEFSVIVKYCGDDSECIDGACVSGPPSGDLVPDWTLSFGGYLFALVPATIGQNSRATDKWDSEIDEFFIQKPPKAYIVIDDWYEMQIKNPYCPKSWILKVVLPADVPNITLTWDAGGLPVDLTMHDIQHNEYYDMKAINSLYLEAQEHTIFTFEVSAVISVGNPYDFNGDGCAGEADAEELSNHFFETPSSPNWNDKYDLNDDNKIDVYDLVKLGLNYGTGSCVCSQLDAECCSSGQICKGGTFDYPFITYATDCPNLCCKEGICTSELQTCSQLGGTCCPSGYECEGNTVSSSDCQTCCAGQCKLILFTCSELGGICCSSGQTCEDGNFQSSSDCDLCCIGGTCSSKIPYEIALRTGWNMISIPVVMSDTPQNVFEGLDIDAVSYYNAQIGSWEGFNPNTPPFTWSLTTITNGKGYWVKSNTNQILTVLGDFPNKEPITLYEGWNMIGSNSDSVYEIDILFEGLDIDAVSYYDASDGTWKGYNPGTPPFTWSLNTIEPGKGYWVKSNKVQSLTFD